MSHNRRVTLVLLIGAIAAFFTLPVMAGGDSSTGGGGGIGWGDMTMKLFGGLALFLYGMEQMSDGLKAVAGERMKLILAKLTTNRFMGAVTGAFVTAVIQSSSVTTVLVVGFVTAGLMSLSQSIGVIMGANIGTTVTAQIVAFKVTKLALLMVAVGFGMIFFSKREKIKNYGAMLMGLGLVFFGMSVMSGAMKPLRSYQPFLDLMTSMENPLIGILIAAAFTGLIQSSSATTGIVIVMATQGLVTLPAGIALAFGANVGTCVTAMLASIGKPREAIRAAVVHVMFNIFGVLVWLAFIPHLAEFVTMLSPKYEELEGIDRLAAEAPRQIANAHTVFNISNTFIFIWFTSQFARTVEWLVPDKPLEEGVIARPKYLDEALLETPSMALDRVKLELGNMGNRTAEMLERSMPAFLAGDREEMKEVARMDDEVDVLHGEVLTYVGHISQKQLTEIQTSDLVDVMSAANDLESIGDLVETDIASLTEECIEKGIKVSDETQSLLKEFHAAVLQSVKGSVSALAESDQRKAQDVIGMKGDIQRMVDAAVTHQATRLIADEPLRLETYTIEVEFIEKLKRIYYFAKRIAKTVVPEAIKEKAG
ncbi:MAG: Na/Pi cotransporter family protein [Gammaproteobacteria bacterium]|nr:Na/Pi cotransporter family protein [Gammaproteobacteria bacterium]